MHATETSRASHPQGCEASRARGRSLETKLSGFVHRMGANRVQATIDHAEVAHAAEAQSWRRLPLGVLSSALHAFGRCCCRANARKSTYRRKLAQLMIDVI